MFWSLSGSLPKPLLTLEEIDDCPQNLRVNSSILSQEEKDFALTLLGLGQHHLFTSWDLPGVKDDEKHQFFEQVKLLDKSYIDSGGLSAYINRARVLLTSSKSGENPFLGWKPEIPNGVTLEPFSPQYELYENKGIPELGACGFVLVAGGLGERLGYNGIKIELPSQTLTNVCYLELYCKQILAIQKRYHSNSSSNLKTPIPLAIMVSDDTIDKTIDLLNRNSYFGMEPGQVTLLKQGKVPALISNLAHIALTSKYEIDAKPHGHGDVHSLMHSTGTAQKWFDEGVKWVVFFQDTNGLALFTLPAMLGVSVDLGLEVNSLAIKRFAKQAIGAISKIVNTQEKKAMTVNVEYNQLDPLLRANGYANGDTNDPVTMASPFPGNINQLLFQLEPYVKVLSDTRGIMPEFVNPKYSDSSKTKFKKPTRLECMMQDYPRLLPSDAQVGFTIAPAWLCYSPCKNNAVDAAASIAAGIPAASAFTAECDQYNVFGEMLRHLGARVEMAEPMNILGITGTPSPRIVFDPSFAFFPHEIKDRFSFPEKVFLSARSCLTIEGDGVLIDGLWLDGSLSLKTIGTGRLRVRAIKNQIREGVVNEGHVLNLLSKASDTTNPSNTSSGTREYKESDYIRGYALECLACDVVEVPSSSPSTSALTMDSGGREYVYLGGANQSLVLMDALEHDDEFSFNKSDLTAEQRGMLETVKDEGTFSFLFCCK